MKRKITAAAAFALCVAMGVCACSPSEKEDTFTGKEKEELAWQPNLDRISPEVYADISNLDLKPGTYISVIGKREGYLIRKNHNSCYGKLIKVKGV